MAHGSSGSRRSASFRRWVLRPVGILAAAVIAAALLLYVTLPRTVRLRTENPAGTCFSHAFEARQAAAGHEIRVAMRFVPLRSISKHVQRAVVIAEDHSFFTHDGIDVAELRAALWSERGDGKRMRGGSTITMQLAKNLYLSPSRNPVRKLREVLIARRLELDLEKRRILEIYLNVIEWGDGVFGIDAAARRYFGKAPADLGPEEAAWLAASIPSPRKANPAQRTRALAWRQQLILRRMRAWRVEGIDP